MKYLHLIGYILWFTASFFCFKLFTWLYDWYDVSGKLFKIIALLVTVLILILGFYKILLALLLLVNKNHKNFNLISTGFSIIGLSGLIASYIYYGFELKIDKSDIFSQSLSLSFGFILVLILINGFILFPKTIVKRNN
jgi:hypothetical protein